MLNQGLGDTTALGRGLHTTTGHGHAADVAVASSRTLCVENAGGRHFLE